MADTQDGGSRARSLVEIPAGDVGGALLTWDCRVEEAATRVVLHRLLLLLHRIGLAHELRMLLLLCLHVC